MASVRQVVRFEAAWTAVLAEHDVGDFHSTEFFAFDPSGQRVGRYRRRSDGTVGRYGEWPAARANRFRDALIATIRSHRMFPLGGAVDVAAFRSRTFGERRYLTGGSFDDLRSRWLYTGAPSKPYFLLLGHCLKVALARAQPGKKLTLVFDRQDQYAARAMEQIREAARYLFFRAPAVYRKFSGAMFLNRAAAPGLQAADLYAHCWHRYASNPKNLGRDRADVMSLLTIKSRRLDWHNAAHLEAVLSSLPESVRVALRDWPQDDGRASRRRT